METSGTIARTLTLGVSVALVAAGVALVLFGGQTLPGLALVGAGMLCVLGVARGGGVASGSGDTSDDGGCD